MNQESKTTTDQSLLRQTFYNNDDELDLLDVVAQLWSGKKTIILTVLVFLLLVTLLTKNINKSLYQWVQVLTQH